MQNLMPLPQLRSQPTVNSRVDFCWVPQRVDHPDDLSGIGIKVGWVERSETRRNTASGAHGGFRCALPTLRFFIQQIHLDGLPASGRISATLNAATG
jgi:hypothetical protein